MNLAVCFTMAGSFTRNFSLSLLFRVWKYSRFGVWLNKICLFWLYVVHDRRKWYSSSTSPLPHIKHSLSSGGSRGLAQRPVSTCRWSIPRRNLDKVFLCMKESGLKMCGESELKSLNLIKVRNLGRVLQSDCQEVLSFSNNEFFKRLIVFCKGKMPWS